MIILHLKKEMHLELAQHWQMCISGVTRMFPPNDLERRLARWNKLLKLLIESMVLSTLQGTDYRMWGILVRSAHSAFTVSSQRATPLHGKPGVDEQRKLQFYCRGPWPASLVRPQLTKTKLETVQPLCSPKIGTGRGFRRRHGIQPQRYYWQHRLGREPWARGWLHGVIPLQRGKQCLQASLPFVNVRVPWCTDSCISKGN